MTNLLAYSKGTLTQRRANTGSFVIPVTNFLFALAPEAGEKFSYSEDTFTEDGNVYKDLLGWKIGDFSEVRQWCDPSDNNGIRLSGLLQAPDGSPVGTQWRFTITQTDGILSVVHYETKLEKKVKNLSDVLLATTAGFGNFAGWLIFRLELVAA